FFQTERGYHGRLYCGLQNALDKFGILNDQVIIEMKYQKSDRHGTHQRPDIVLHTPAELHDSPVDVGNLAVFALKHQATQSGAQTDFRKLDTMFEQLHYPLGIFINVNSSSHYLNVYDGPYRDRLHSFGVQLDDCEVTVTHASWVNDNVVENIG
ncbi:MAG: hypothetical protein ABI596_10490, partial [Pyrinomonadaceae bacterium]